MVLAYDISIRTADPAEVRNPYNIGHKKVIAVIPAYNEVRFINSVVLRMRKYADLVLVVDDGSTDTTAQAAEVAGAVVVRHTQNRGKGAALRTGFYEASKLSPDVVVTIDGDGQHLPEETIKVIAPVLAGRADLVVGSRYLENTSNVPRHRRWGHFIFNFLINQISGVSLSDTQSGFRAFSARALQALSFQSDGFAVESEMQFLAWKHELKLTEVPITVNYHQGPKRLVIIHGLMVMSGLLQLAAQHRPLFSLSISSLFLLLAGLVWEAGMFNIFQNAFKADTEYILNSSLANIISILIFPIGIVLHSGRRLMFSLIQSIKPETRSK